MYSTLISALQLQALRGRSDVVVFDCSFDLADPHAGFAQFQQNHVAAAQYVHLDDDLSAKRPEQLAINGGRHPLPTKEAFAAWLGERGVAPDTQVVVYDRQANMYCGRLWWMCQWVGHRACAVLDGGLAAWQATGGAVQTSAAVPASAISKEIHPVAPEFVEFVATQTVANCLGSAAQTIVDARAAPRFRGEVEPLDPVAGHIPGALNRPFTLNMDANGFFKPAEVLRQEFDALLAGRDPASVVHHCGSGVTATPNVLAMVIAGYPPPKLYAGSWSEWCSVAGAPVARG